MNPQNNLRLSLLLLILPLVACGDKSPQAVGGPGGPGGMPPPEVEVLSVTTAPVTSTRELPGRLIAPQSAQVRARVEGVVEKVLFPQGGEVEAGDSLYQIDARTYETAAAAARADADLAQATLKRYQALLPEHAVSQQDVDQALARFKQAQATLAKAELDMENADVTAPISGHIGRALVTEGALVGKGEATLLAVIEQTNPMLVDFTQTYADFSKLSSEIAAGKKKSAARNKVELILDDGSVYAYPGKLVAEETTVDPTTGALVLRASFPNPKRQLLSGAFVRVRLPEAITDNAIAIPQRAVQVGAQGQFVTIVDKDGKAAVRPIKTGSMSGTDWIINEGLMPGDKVIVNGLQKARPGAPVKAVEWNPRAAAVEAQQAMSGMAGMGQASSPQQKHTH